MPAQTSVNSEMHTVQYLLVQTASVNVDCRKAEWLECFISCIISCHTPARVVKEDEESRSEPHDTPKHNQNSVVE